MSEGSERDRCDRAELVSAYALGALPAGETRLFDAHLASCPDCQRELQRLRPAVDALRSSPAEFLQPSDSLWDRLHERIRGEASEDTLTGGLFAWREPEWEEVAPGICCKLLATDMERDRVSMLVRLAPGVAYPPHRHAGVEELFLLDGELWIDHRKLYPGDYYRAEAGTADQRVWSATGCVCLLITSPSDVISEPRP
jgi:anti-sigma factor ChrR (cupin superfamily)